MWILAALISKVRRLLARSFGEHYSTALGFKAQSSFGPAFRARRFHELNFRATTFSLHSFKAHLSKRRTSRTTLFGVQLMGVFLNRAQLQGASLAVVNLSGASLSNAQLQGTFFGNSQVWGVSLESAQLQGTGLLSGLAGTDLRKSVMWRTYSSARLGVLTSELTWGPRFLDKNDQLIFWTQEKYGDMRRLLERNVPVGDDRIKALRRIEILDCEKKRFSPLDLEIGEEPFDRRSKPRYLQRF